MSEEELVAQKENQDPNAVWMACRANGKGCGGNHAKKVFDRKIPLQAGGGRAIRYQCLNCGGTWHVRI